MLLYVIIVFFVCRFYCCVVVCSVVVEGSGCCFFDGLLCVESLVLSEVNIVLGMCFVW